jgi:predicted permease
VRSLVRLSRVDLGLRPERVLALPLDLGAPAYSEPRRAWSFLAALLRGLGARPGIRSASVVTGLPLRDGGNMSAGVGLRPDAPLSWQIDLNGIGPGYFSTLGIPLLRGRDFTAGETADDRHPVVILSASAARRLWPGEEPLGKRVILNLMAPVSRQVVGVAGDVREIGPDVPPHPEAYLPYPQLFFGSANLMVHTRGDSLPWAREVRRQVRELDRGLPLGAVIPMERIVEARIANPTTDARILTSFAAAGLLLTTIGVYGVTAFTVAQRRREIGVRIALGARPEDVVRSLLRESAGWLGLGLLLGLGGGALLSRLLAGILYGVTPLDPWTFALAPLLPLATALGAAYAPARGAALLDPLQALSRP